MQAAAGRDVLHDPAARRRQPDRAADRRHGQPGRLDPARRSDVDLRPGEAVLRAPGSAQSRHSVVHCRVGAAGRWAGRHVLLPAPAGAGYRLHDAGRQRRRGWRPSRAATGARSAFSSSSPARLVANSGSIPSCTSTSQRAHLPDQVSPSGHLSEPALEEYDMEALVRLSFYCFAAATIAFVASAACYLAYAVGRVRLRQTDAGDERRDDPRRARGEPRAGVARRRPLRHPSGLVRRRRFRRRRSCCGRSPAGRLPLSNMYEFSMHLRPPRRCRLPALRALVWRAPARGDRVAARSSRCAPTSGCCRPTFARSTP